MSRVVLSNRSSSSTSTALRLCLHGEASFRRLGTAARPLERKHAALLAYLWLEGPTSRSRLAGLLWPEVGEARARGNLRQRLLKLRQDAGDLVQDRNGLLALAEGVAVDDPAPPASTLLGTLEFDDSPALAEWLARRRQAALDERKRELLLTVRLAAQAGRLDEALQAADRLLEADRESEEAHRALMEVYYLRGDHAAAIAAWDRCRETLRQLYGIAPSAATRQLGDTILAGVPSAAVLPALADTTPPAAVLRPPRLVGRSQALGLLHQGWQQGRILLVAGEAGIGKSRLLSDWLTTVGPFAMAAGRPGDAVLPYASLSRLLLAAIDRFGPPLDSLDARSAARLLPRLATLVGAGTAAPARTDHERSQALDALRRLFEACAKSAPVVLVLDDLQFADAASLEALRGLVEPEATAVAAATSLRFAFGTRPDEQGPQAAALLASLEAAGQLQRVDLAPLDEAQTAALLGSLGVPRLQPHADGSTIPLWRQVGGNPAFLLESVKLLLALGVDRLTADAALPLPPSIERVVQQRIELLSPQARHLAQLAAIAGAGYSIPLAAAALACSPLALSDPLRELELRQVFYGRRFVHDVIESVTLRSVPATVADFMHRFVAEHLGANGGEPAIIATHWQACGEWRRAGQRWAEAARLARAASQVNAQAEFLGRAIDAFVHDPSAQAELFAALIDRVDAAEAPGHGSQRPGDVARLLALACSDEQQLQALAVHIGLMTDQGKSVDTDAARQAVDRALALARPDLAWMIGHVLSWHLSMTGRTTESLLELQRHVAWIEQAGDVPAMAQLGRCRAAIHGFADELVLAVREGERAADAQRTMQDWPALLPTLANLGMMLHWRGEHPAARTVLTEARELRLRLHGRGTGTGILIDAHLGAVLRDLGETAEATERLEGALAALAALPTSELVRSDRALVEHHLAQLWLMAHQPDRAAALLEADPPDLAERYAVRRLTLRLRLQRLRAAVDGALADQLHERAAALDSPFNRVLAEFELTRLLPPHAAVGAYVRLHDDPVSAQRPGLQLHAAAMAADAARRCGESAAARRWHDAAAVLLTSFWPFDIGIDEVRAVLAKARI